MRIADCSTGFVERPCAVAAIDVGGTKMAAALVRYSEAGSAPSVEALRSVPTNAHLGGKTVLENLTALASGLIADAERSGCKVCGIGVGTAGRVDARSGSIAFANELMPGWTGQPVADQLRKACSRPVAVLNDVKAHALGEARWGAARGAQTCLVIAAGTGLGGGIIANGRVLLGSHGFAGELGRTPCPDKLGTPRACGSASDLESIASGSGIESRYRTLTGQTLSGSDVADLASQGDDRALRVITEAGRALGEAIASWADLFDPELVVLSGSVCNAGEAWTSALRQGFEDQATPVMRDLPIVAAELGNRAPVVGAAEYLLDSLEGRL